MRSAKLLWLVPMLGVLGCPADDDTDDTDTDTDTDEPLAEALTLRITNIGAMYPIYDADIVDIPAGDSERGPLTPGESYVTTFDAGPRHRLSLATMLIPSNDLVIALPPEGVALYDEDQVPLPGDLSGRLRLYDAGTEVNETPGEGPNQPAFHDDALPPDEQGDEEGGLVTEITPPEHEGAQGYTWPAPEDVLDVDLTYDGGTTFTLTVTNVGEEAIGDGGPAPVSRMIFAVHSDRIALFEVGDTASDALELLAEAGLPGDLLDGFADRVGVTPLFSPGVWVVHDDDVQVYAYDVPASEGLEELAEDGAPDALLGEIELVDGVHAADAFRKPVIGLEPPLAPGMSFESDFEAFPGDRLSVATMWVPSNDLFVATPPEGVPLFVGTVPVEAALEVRLNDAGTEVNQPPGAGLDQAPRQDGADTGPDEDGVVRRIEDLSDGFEYGDLDNQVEIRVVPQD